VFAQLIQDPTKINFVEKPAPAPAIDAFGQLPQLASTFDHVDGLFYFTYIVCIFFFVLIVAVLLLAVVKYRRTTWDQPAASNRTHNTPLEVVWTIVPLIIVMVMFAWGFKGSLDMLTPPLDATRNTYKATAKQWNWTFAYPNHPTPSYNEVWLQVGKPVQFACESLDVLHAFFVPSMRVKRDVIPGRFQTVWFTPTQLGDYHLFCAEYCGEDHSKMYAQVHVVTAEEFAKAPWAKWDDSTVAEAVKSAEGLYKQLCVSCHSVNGMPGVGPSWKGLFAKGADGKIVGRQREVIEGGQKKTITVDDAYLQESIWKPMQKLAAEFPVGGMSDFPDLDPARSADPKMADRKVKALIEYMKSLAEAK
jgi:cytochrome c oxidase subunit 2